MQWPKCSQEMESRSKAEIRVLIALISGHSSLTELSHPYIDGFRRRCSTRTKHGPITVDDGVVVCCHTCTFNLGRHGLPGGTRSVPV